MKGGVYRMLTNQQYYIDGYHIYYDRKILRQKEVEQLKSKLE